MWPWGHLAFAYLVYVGCRRCGFARSGSVGAVLMVGFGSQFPDLVDKPLAWYLGMLSSGRSLSHSLLVVGPLCALAVLVADRFGRRDLAAGFAVGVFTHVFADAMPAAAGSSDPAFLGWPITAVPSDGGTSPSLSGMLVRDLREPAFYGEIGLVAVAIAVRRHRLR